MISRAFLNEKGFHNSEDMISFLFFLSKNFSIYANYKYINIEDDDFIYSSADVIDRKYLNNFPFRGVVIFSLPSKDCSDLFCIFDVETDEKTFKSFINMKVFL